MTNAESDRLATLDQIHDALEQTGWLAPYSPPVGTLDPSMLLDVELAVRKAVSVVNHALARDLSNGGDQIRNSILVGLLETLADQLSLLRRGMQSELLKPAFASGHKRGGTDNNRLRLKVLIWAFLKQYSESYKSPNAAHSAVSKAIRARGKSLAVRTIRDDAKWIEDGLAGSLSPSDWDGHVRTLVMLELRDLDLAKVEPEERETRLRRIANLAAECRHLRSPAERKRKSGE